MSEHSHEEMIQSMISSQFKETPYHINRITIGICNEVYCVGLKEYEVIVRLSPDDRFLMGSHDHIPQFKALGIQVPDILAEDYSKKLIPFSYQVLSKIEGQDLGQVIGTLSDKQLKDLAQEIADIFNKVKTIPTSDQFGVIWGGGDNELSDSWTERMQIWIEDSKERGLDDETINIADNLYGRYQPYFSDIKPIMYYGDISYKNVMIHHGTFNGLVDLDGLTQGDPLEALGRIELAWYATRHGKIYSTAIMDELQLNKEQRKLVTMYALLNQISMSCENDIQFNQNTKLLDEEKKQKEKRTIKKLAFKLGLL